MARKTTPQMSEDLKNLVRDVERSLSSADADTYGKLRRIHDRSHQIRTIVKAWKDQQTQDRKWRERYATYLMIAIGVQALIVNAVFVLIGLNVLTFEAWTARTFIMSVFAEIAAMGLVVVKYLFTPLSDNVLLFLSKKKRTTRKRH
jgi:hypothetical protein